MDLNSLKPEDAARRYALLLCICLGCFAFIACWLAFALNPMLAALLGAVVAALLFWPLRAVMRLMVR